MNYNRVHGDHVDLPPRGIDVQKVHIRRVLYGKNRNSSSYLVLAGFTVVVEKLSEDMRAWPFPRPRPRIHSTSNARASYMV